MKVYEAIQRVSAALAKEGVGKGRRNDQQGYAFRGIDEVMNTLAPMLPAHGLLILPRYGGRTVVERTTQKGGVLFSVTVEAHFDFVAVEDGSTHTVTMYGEAMDSGDKATNKAMSAAYKYAACQAFCIPIEGQADADATTPETLQPQAPAGYGEWLTDLSAVVDNGIDALKAAWQQSPIAFRQFITSTNAGGWEGMKAAAQKKTDALVPKATKKAGPQAVAS
jgi:hypothetical protein